MSLDFTTIPDREGAAVYLLHSNSITQQKQLEEMAEQLSSVTTAQIVIVDANDNDGQQICQFYDLDSDNFPHILIIRDNDELAGQWSGSDMPTTDLVAYTVNTINGS